MLGLYRPPLKAVRHSPRNGADPAESAYHQRVFQGPTVKIPLPPTLSAALCLGLLAAAGTPAAAAVVGPVSMSAEATGTPSRRGLTVTVRFSAVDATQQGNLYVAAKLPDGTWYALSRGSWSPVGNELPAYSGPFAYGTHSIELLRGQDATPLAGTEIYVGYGASAEELIARQQYKLVFTLPGAIFK